MKVSILGLHKALILEALYDGALYQAAKFDVQPAIREQAVQGKAPSLFVKQMLANQFIKERSRNSGYPNYQFGTIDLGSGPRELAIDLSGFEIDVGEYNELHGEGAAQKIIAKLYGELPKKLEQQPSKAKSEEKNIFNAAIQDNSGWLQPILPEIMLTPAKEGEKAKDFAADLDKIISEHKVQEKYEKKPEQAIYLTWIKMLDPKIDQQTKENLCSELAKHYADAQGGQAHKVSIGGTLSYMPSIIAASILLYSPLKVLSAYYEYQKKYGKFSRELVDGNFETTLTFLLNNKIFPAQAKTLFLKKLTEMLKQRMQKSYFNQDNPDYLLHQAMSSWEKHSLTALVSEYFDQELRDKHDKFKEKLQKTLENPEGKLELHSEFGSLAFEKLLVEYKCNAETLTPVVMRFTNNEDMQTLAAIYTAHGLNTLEMFKRHLIQLAKATNEPGHYEFSSLFFSKCLEYLKDSNVKSIAPEIASFLSAKYYAEHAYAFTAIRQEIFALWIDNKPEQIVAIVKAILGKRKDDHETPIDKFFFDLSYAKMPESFYDKLAILLSDELTPEQFINVYTVAPEETQRKLLSALLADEEKALTRLKKLWFAYKAGDFSATLPREISNQLKIINPKLHAQAGAEQLFVEPEAKDDLETDLHLLEKILTNESLTHDERRSEMRKLENLHTALRDEKSDTCAATVKMFNTISQERWPDLFVYFDAQIIHWNFPYDERHLKLLYSDQEKKPAPRQHTWLSHQTEWEDILYGTLVAIMPNLSTGGLTRNVAHWALSSLDQAFTKSSSHFPGMMDRVLKKFFLENLPSSIQIFKTMHDKFQDKYHEPEYFSREGIYAQVASWLPEGETRFLILTKLLQVEGFEPALKSPFVRSPEEVAKTALALINTRSAHIVNLFEKLPSHITSAVFKSVHQFDEQGFLKLLQTGFSDIGKTGLVPVSDYMRLVVMLLSYSRRANIDIFKIIDADPNKDFLLKMFSNIETWEKSSTFSCPYELIFKIAQHYQPEQLQKIVFEHVQRTIKKNDLFDLCLCIKAAQKVTGDKHVLPQQEEAQFVDYLMQKMPEAFAYPHTEIEVMANFIPNFDTLFLELIAKEVVAEDTLDSKHKECLDSLVRAYGFPRINAICLDLKLVDCSAYLVEKFSKFPDILQQMDDAAKLYNHFFENHQYKIEDEVRWSFESNLHLAIAKAAKESKTMTCDINVAEVGAKSGVAPDLIALMPPLRITSSRADVLDDAPKAIILEASTQSSSSEVKSLTDHFGLHKKRKREIQQPEKDISSELTPGFLTCGIL